MQLNVAIMAGGPSSERVISLQTAANIADSLRSDAYRIWKIDINGANWIYDPKGIDETPVDKNDFSIRVKGDKIRFDIAVIAIHGKQGEDGTMQGYFEAMNIPYSTSDVLSSALSYDKIRCKIFLKNWDIPMAREIVIRKGDSIQPETIVSELGLPVFVKPNTAGSSFGVTKVYEKDKLRSAIEHAFTEDKQVIVEQFIDGVEVSCGVLKTAISQRVFPVTEIDTKRDFFDYDAKYTPELTDEITPARSSEAETKAVQQYTSLVYDKLGFHGLVRVDFIIKSGVPYYLEANTIPGLSKNSIVPKQIRSMGLSETEIFNEVITDSLRRHKEKQ
ncbi:MAG TPA: D-alanine--D-alanine ligase [Bacteroidales bacterium]|nr:D-alanine--D-alanine ligase [Bacteroidales bacterium]